jgi:hypothetical protein
MLRQLCRPASRVRAATLSVARRTLVTKFSKVRWRARQPGTVRTARWQPV